MAKRRTRDHADTLLADANVGRALPDEFIVWNCGCRRLCKRRDCYGPYALIDADLDELVASRFDTPEEALRHCLLCVLISVVRRRSRMKPDAAWVDQMRGPGPTETTPDS
jgi:hypothetical protein